MDLLPVTLSAAHRRPPHRPGRQAALLLAVATLLASCGGGGGDAPPPDPSLSLADAAALESDGQLQLTVNVLSRNGADPATALTLGFGAADIRSGTGYAQGGSSCSAGVDYVIPAAGTSVTVPAGASSAVLTLSLCPDARFEPNEVLQVNVGINQGSGSTASLRVLASARATILNSDPGGLNDTGIASCADASGATTACSSTLPGQDAQRGRDSQAATQGGSDGALGFAYGKRDGSGNALAAGSGDWACVQDQVTGLLWQADATAPALLAWSSVADQVAAANTARLCGRNDWRLPQADELASLIHSGRSSGLALDPDWWRDAQTWASGASAPYWTASQWPDDANTAIAIDFALGVIGPRNKASANRAAVRLVSGSAASAAPASVCDESTSTDPSARFVNHGDGSVTDTRTGLMWMRCSLGQSGAGCANGTASLLSWSQALTQAAQANSDSSNALGSLHGDWRLPNRNELASLVERSCRRPAIHRGMFPGTGLGSWWSASPVPRLAGMAWSTDFVDGDVAPAEVDSRRMVRLVRGGQ